MAKKYISFGAIFKSKAPNPRTGKIESFGKIDVKYLREVLDSLDDTKTFFFFDIEDPKENLKQAVEAGRMSADAAEAHLAKLPPTLQRNFKIGIELKDGQSTTTFKKKFTKVSEE